jgi:hypothetical protein
MTFPVKEKNDKTEFVFIKGKFKYAPKLTSFSDFNKWVVCIYPDAESMKVVNKLKEDGIRNVLKKDEDGYYISFSRPPSIKVRGAEVLMAPPEVMDKEGKPITVPIGAGSDGYVKLEIYGGPLRMGGRYKAARLVGVRVDNLVPWQKGDLMSEEIKRQEGLAEQAEMLW